MPPLDRDSCCKINLLLNILRRREDGFHELETVMLPVPLHDHLRFEAAQTPGIQLSCSDPSLPVDETNLVHRAASLFLRETQAFPGVRIHLEKQIPMAAGLGGGSGNAATTLVALNDLAGKPLSEERLHTLASQLGSDVPFFIGEGPALGTGRGEQIQRLPSFPALKNCWLALVHPGFGVSTAWAYQNLRNYPEALNGKPGRAKDLIQALTLSLKKAATHFYNSLEAPVLTKHPILRMYQEFFTKNGAEVAMMSGSGSTTFAIFSQREAAETSLAEFPKNFGSVHWSRVVPLGT